MIRWFRSSDKQKPTAAIELPSAPVISEVQVLRARIALLAEKKRVLMRRREYYHVAFGADAAVLASAMHEIKVQELSAQIELDVLEGR